MIFSGLSKGRHTAPDEIFKVYVQYLSPLLRTQVVSYPCNYTPGIRSIYIVYVVSIIIFVCVCVYLLF